MPLTALLIIVVFVGYKVYTDAQDKARFRALTEQSKQGRVAGTLKDLQMLIRKLEDEPNSTTAGQIIGQVNAGEQTDELVARAVRGAKTPWARKNIALAVEARGTEAALEGLLLQLDIAKEPEVRIALWRALGRIASAGDVPRLLEKFQSENVDEIGAGEGALTRAALQGGRSLQAKRGHPANLSREDAK